MTDTPASRTVLVTGAARGIGRAIAERFAADGWHVAGLDIAPVALAHIRAVTADVADPAEVARAVDGLGDFLAPGLGCLVNCAGVAGAHAGPLTEQTLETWQRTLAVNLTGPWLMARAVAPQLRRARGSIVNITSTRAQMSEPGCEPYAASKGGLTALTHALAVSLAPDVRVNAVAPGWIDTTGAPLSETDHAQHPAGRVGRPADIAEAAAYLATAGFVTGAVHIVDGGMTRKMIYAD